MRADNASLQMALKVARRWQSLSGEQALLARQFVELYDAHFAPQEPLTRYQRRVFEFVVAYTGEHGFAPSLTEIAEHFNYRSLSGVHEHLANLERKRWIRRRFNEARSIEVLDGAA